MLRTILATSLLALAAAAALPVLLPQEMPTPVEQHKQLLADVGEWEGTLTMAMPGMPEQKIPATETIVGVGGFWTQARFQCDMFGMPYVGTGCLGYDAAKKKYVGTWADSMSSQLAVMEGEWDAARKLIVMRWKGTDMATGEPTPHRSETARTAESYTSTFYAGEGEGTKTMVISMKRKAKAPAAPGTAK